MTDIEIARMKRILREAGFPERDVEWMAESCPDACLAEKYYGSGKSLYVGTEEEGT